MAGDNVEPEIPFEYQLFALAIKEPGAIVYFRDNLDPKDVGLVHGNEGLHEIYTTMLEYQKQTGLDSVDPIALKAWIQTETDIYHALGGTYGVDKLVDSFVETSLQPLSNHQAVVEVIKFRAKKRRQLDKAQELLTLISKKSNHDDADIDKIQKITEQIKELQTDLKYDPFADVSDAYSIANDINDLWDIPPFLVTQFPNINEAMGYSKTKGGFLRGGVTAIVAHSGKGKSTLSRSLCNFWLDNGHSILYINFEEPKQHWERTLMTQVTGQNVYAIADTITDAQKSTLNTAFAKKMHEWGERLMVRHDPDSLYFEDLEKWLRTIIGNNRSPDVVVIDTIQSMFTKSGGKARWGDYEEMMVRLEKLAKDMDAVFIITTQLNNNSLRESREVIDQSDIGGSVVIVQKATVTLVLTPMKTAEGDDSIDETLMQIQMPKNRITGNLSNNKPPIIKYVDAIKSYVPWKVLDDSNYDPTVLDMDFLDGSVY